MAAKGRTRQEDAHRANSALQMRIRGESWVDIAAALEYSTEDAARNAVNNLLKRNEHRGVKELRSLSVARLEAIVLSHWDEATKLEDTGAFDANGDPVEFDWRRKHSAAGVIVKTMERMAKLTGADMPTQVENVGSAPLTVVLDAGIAEKGGEKELPTMDVD